MSDRKQKETSACGSQFASHSNKEGLQIRKRENSKRKRKNSWAQSFGVSGWSSEPRVGRVVNGLPKIVDRCARLKALGNAIVPQVAYELFRFIERIEK